MYVNVISIAYKYYISKENVRRRVHTGNLDVNERIDVKIYLKGI
jgi:hypothetical protein